MNRNVESHFSVNPTSLDIGRSQFDRSSTIKFSGNVGDLIPFYVDEVLPGDTFKVETSKIVRLQTMLKPIMDNMYLDTYYFFVPNRLVWDKWVNFCGETEQAWNFEAEYNVPRLGIINHPGVGSLADYMGIPINVSQYNVTADHPEYGVNALPFRAYAKICDDWFRDQNLMDPLDIPTGSENALMNSKDSDILDCAYGGPVFKACKYHDYFTSCLPGPQSGPTVNIPAGSLAKVGTTQTTWDGMLESGSRVEMRFTGGPKQFKMLKEITSSDPAIGNIVANVNSSSYDTSTYSPVVFTNLYADIQSALGTINDLRIAFQVQKFYEKMSRGRRYIEVLKSQFGVTSPDARLQRSEYLGGNRIPIVVHEVTNNSEGENAFLGNLGAMSRTVDVHDDFVHSFTEHGFVIGVCCVRYDHTYGQGLERFWQRYSPFDYYWPVFANIGEQAVLKKEICYNSNVSYDELDEVFGYQEAWADYRYKPNRVAGEMRVDAPNSLASWHLADNYDYTHGEFYPYLSEEWIREDKTNVDRTLAVTSSVANQFFADIYVKNICTRVMPMYSIPGLADHH